MSSPLPLRIEAVRRFNRFYTRRIGVLSEGHLGSPFSLAEVRVLYELAQEPGLTASGLCGSLGLDAGYLSRLLQRLERQGLVGRRPSPDDARSSRLALTDRGDRAFADLDARARRDVGRLLEPLPEADQDRVVGAMATLSGLLGGSDAPAPRAWSLRTHRPGDLGWIVHRHGVLYAQEYGWNEEFEALCARICADFVDHFDPRRERCWLAEMDGGIVGSVFVVKKSQTVARLRLLLVEPRARGLGIGRRLVAECLRFAEEAGYRRMTLWTNSVLDAARHLYEEAGFCRVSREKHQSFGKKLVAEVWERKLGAAGG